MLTITSIFNPVNWIKFTKDPKKGFEVLKKIICDYPRIQKLLKIKNKFLRKQIINFYNFFVSHNKSLKFFFLEKHNICEKIYFNKNDLDFSGGLLVQVLPKAAHEPALITLLEERCKEITSFSEILYDCKNNLYKLLEEIFPELDKAPLKATDRRQKISFSCPCSRERSVAAFKLLGKEELGTILIEDGQAELVCHFCNTKYLILGDEISSLMKEF